MENEVRNWNWRGWPHVLTLILLACLAAPHAKAAPICYPWDSAATNYELSTVPESKVQWLFASADKASFTVTWWCDARYNWKREGFVGIKSMLVPGWETILEQAKNGTKAQRDAIWDLYIRCPNIFADTPECEPYKPLRQGLTNQFNATTPVPIDWFVRDNPAATTRPCFTGNRNADGVWIRNPTQLSNSTCRVADTNARCLPNLIVTEESGGTYASIMGLPNLGTPQDDVIGDNIVALCVRTN